MRTQALARTKLRTRVLEQENIIIEMIEIIGNHDKLRKLIPEIFAKTTVAIDESREEVGSSLMLVHTFVFVILICQADVQHTHSLMDIATSLRGAMDDLKILDQRGFGDAFTIDSLRTRFRGGIEAREALRKKVAESVAGVLTKHVLSTATRFVAADRLISELDGMSRLHAKLVVCLPL